MKEAQRRIDEWTDGPLDLSRLGLSSVPDSIGNLTNLTELRLDVNQLSSVPDSIGNLTNLTQLRLDVNQLSSVPDSIGNLTNLTQLLLGGNQLSSVPDSIGNLTNLTELRLDGNQLSSVPDSIGNLTNLTQLRLDVNQLSSVPDSIGNLTNLTELRLDVNQLSSVPDSIGNLTNLTGLWLYGNQLSSVPDSIGNLTNLTQLRLYGNQLSSVPDSIGNLTNLTGLWLYGNQLSSVPDSIGNLTNLTLLWLYGNQLSSLPVSMTQLGALTSVDMTEQPTSAPVGSLFLGGNRWSDEFRQAADEGIEALWEHLKNQAPDDDQDQLEPPNDPPLDPMEPISVGDIYDFERVARLDTDAADRLRAHLEPFIGQIELLLQNGSYTDPEVELQVEYELGQLREELFGDKPGEPLGSIVHGYFTSLLDATLPLLDVSQLRAASEDRGVDSAEIESMVEAGTNQGGDPADVGPAIEVADKAQVLAPPEIPPRDRARWVANSIGWVSDSYRETLTAAGGSLAVATGAKMALDLTWLNPVWAAVVGAVFGVAGAIAKAVGAKDES